MKNPTPLPHSAQKPGFAIIVTVSILVLLAVIAVGLLTLSTVTVRTASLGSARAEAEANARLALMLALGDLQKSLGPDQRISAPATLLDANAAPTLTGVWESYRLKPQGGDNLSAIKRTPKNSEAPNGEFVAWLTSDATDASPQPTPPNTSAGPGRATLLELPDQPALGAKIITVQQRGGLAWTTIDESLKARFNLPEIASADQEAAHARLRAPERNAVQITDALRGYTPDENEAARVASYQSGALASTNSADWQRHFHHFTSWSAGLATNVVDGGLKGDLTLAFERATLPSTLAGRHVYSNQQGTQLTPNDPYFDTLADYYRLYQTNNGLSDPLLTTVPKNYQPTTRSRTDPTFIPNPKPTEGALLAPVVTRVNVAFSLVGREAHGHWVNTIPNRSGDASRTYMVYLIYTPVVTLYNPYTVPLQVNGMQVSFQYLPLAFQFYRNGRPQNNRPALLSQFHISSQNSTEWEDKFTANLVANSGSSGSSSVTLKPGEARVFGVNHPRGTTWGQMTNYLWQNDLANSKTLNLTTRDGWNYNSGFIVDWLAPTGAGQAADNSTLGVFGVRGTDTIDVAFTPAVPTYNGRAMDYFSVEIAARVNNSNRPTTIGAYRYRYGTVDRLKTAMEAGAHPALGRIAYPVRRERPWRFNEIYQRSIENTAIENWTGPKQFALFTLAARTPQDSLYPTKAGRDTSFVHHVLDMDISETHPAQMPMELSFLPVTGQGANTVGSLEVWSADDPRSFFFSGWSVNTGFLNYPTYPVPRAPLVNIADLRHANLASSGHLPLRPYTVGESYAPPHLPSTTAIGPAGPLGYAMADDSWLANNALWDNYYFSGIRPTDLRTFLEDSRSPLTPRLRPHLPGGMSVTGATATLDSEKGWESSAGFQFQRGSFNVQSTSVEAWKTVLSALNKETIPGANPTTYAATDYVSQASPFPRMIDGPSPSLSNLAAADNQSRWTGFRDLSEEEITRLAEEIVAAIRRRGPFLSMSEFVNRELSAAGSDKALSGLLEEAIEKSGLNSASPPPAPRLVSSQEASTFGYANPAAAEGDTEEGASAFLTQGDLLSAIGSFLTVRGDTFTIRAYGDSRDASGKVLASATCEAVIQRVPEYVDATNPFDAVTPRQRTALSEVNERFGRRFKVASFRWVPAEEV